MSTDLNEVPKRGARVYRGYHEWGWYVHRTMDGTLVDDTSGVGYQPERFYDAWFPDHEFAILAAVAWTRSEPSNSGSEQ